MEDEEDEEEEEIPDEEEKEFDEMDSSDFPQEAFEEEGDSDIFPEMRAPKGKRGGKKKKMI